MWASICAFTPNLSNKSDLANYYHCPEIQTLPPNNVLWISSRHLTQNMSKTAPLPVNDTLFIRLLMPKALKSCSISFFLSHSISNPSSRLNSNLTLSHFLQHLPSKLKYYNNLFSGLAISVLAPLQSILHKIATLTSF